ncbi:unnamed protein product [Miscanthus lutarioriparius]|uniref:laccase n=1 Tax=Miscanthus lutarioriparius TaxID=422564 RepID=A0A811NT79_9POAL|nr:unnamed protein product [Miscanthus lutarioriparius]
MSMVSSRRGLPLVLSALLLAVLILSAQADVKRYQFDIVMSNMSRLCHAKSMVTVNGSYPGPTVYAREGDRVVVRVTNRVEHNVTIHWHGLKQRRNGWADGPAYVTQCPIQGGAGSYTYDFNVTGQRGRLWWHAHIAWLRATVHGAIVVLPERGVPYPFPKPDAEAEIILGEWWHADVDAVEKQGRMLGMAPNTSDAHTINGKPGPLFPCSEKHTYALQVQWGKTYILRVINAAVNDELFFSIAGHTMTVVEIDATYTKPLAASTIQLSPGQTTNVLVRADQRPGRYFMAAKPFNDVPVPADNKAATAILQYAGVPTSARYPADVPRAVDRHLLYTIGLNVDLCASCVNGSHLVASLNNITFMMPRVALLQAHYGGLRGVFAADFPDRPPARFNYTGVPLTAGLATSLVTRLSKLAYNSSVELVLQDTNLLSVESHPFHLHGYNFFVVGRGLGNFDPAKDPAKYNLVDPPERNTVGVPAGGWTAIRFRADNPGVWFLHCHLEVHTSWGLKMAFLVEDGNGPDQSALPPPKDLPKC